MVACFFSRLSLYFQDYRISPRVTCRICNKLNATVFDENTDHSPYTNEFIQKTYKNVHKTVFTIFLNE